MKTGYCDQSNQRGVGLIAAIFVIVILAMLGTALIRVVTTEQRSMDRSFASLQTYLAAQTAVEWGLYQGIQGGGNPANVSFSDLNLPGEVGLSECIIVSEDDFPLAYGGNGPVNPFGGVGGGSLTLYSLEAEAVCYQDSNMETRRRLEVRWGPNP